MIHYTVIPYLGQDLASIVPSYHAYLPKTGRLKNISLGENDRRAILERFREESTELLEVRKQVGFREIGGTLTDIPKYEIYHAFKDKDGAIYLMRKVPPIGKGSFGSVCVAAVLSKGENASVEEGLTCVVKMEETPTQAARQNVEREVSILKEVGLLFGSFSREEARSVPLDLMATPEDSVGLEAGSADRLPEAIPLESVQVACEWFKKMAQELERVHQFGFYHMDIKPENFLHNAETGEIRLVDFGLSNTSAFFEGKHVDGYMMGTPHYMAPEFYESEDARIVPLSTKQDMFALGMSFALILKKQLESTLGVQYDHVPRRLIEQLFIKPVPLNNPENQPELEAWNVLIGVMIKMTDANPENRPEAGEVAAVLDFVQALTQSTSEEIARIKAEAQEPYAKWVCEPVAAHEDVHHSAYEKFKVAEAVRLAKEQDMARREAEAKQRKEEKRAAQKNSLIEKLNEYFIQANLGVLIEDKGRKLVMTYQEGPLEPYQALVSCLSSNEDLCEADKKRKNTYKLYPSFMDKKTMAELAVLTEALTERKAVTKRTGLE